MRVRPPAGTTSGLALLGALFTVGPAAPAAAQEANLDQFSVRVDSVVVVGNQRHPANVIITRSGLRPGNIVRQPQIQNAIRRLFSSGDFSDVVVGVTDSEDPEQGVFYIGVEERPYITQYVFRGLERVGEDVIRDTVGLPHNSPLDPHRIARARATMLDLLSNEGFPTASVDTLIRPDPAFPPDYLVVFDVEEGPRLGLTTIAFDGNEAFTDAELRTAMATDEEGFFWFDSGELKKDEYRRDLTERLPEFYRANGYLDFEVLGDTIVSDRVTGKGRIEIRVHEGEQYLLEDLRITGNRAFPLAALEPIVRRDQHQPRDGETYPPFNFTAFYAAPADLGDLYRNNGYLASRVTPDVRRVTVPEGEAPRVTAHLYIDEGVRSYIREISIEGNTATHDRVIRNRLFIFPGDVYSQERLIQSFQAIQGLNFFEPLPPDEAINIRPRPDGDIDISLRVQEKQTGTLNFGITASGFTGLAGFIGYQQPNLFGLAKTGSFRWIFGRRQQDLDISYSDPEVLGSHYSGTISLRNSRDQFTGFSLGDRRQRGGLTEVGTPIFGIRSTRVFMGYSLFDDEVRGLDTTNVVGRRFSLFSGTRSSLSWRLVQDTRNNPVFPTSGARNQLAIRQTGGLLGGDGNYRKIDLTSEWFVPVGQLGGGPGSTSPPIELTFGLSFETGLILGRNPFFTERYYVGGTQAGIQLRGYDEASVTPSGHIPEDAPFSDLDRVGESFFRTGVTFGIKLTSNIFTSAFLDAGNVWLDANQLNPTDLLVGAGIGASLVTPFGPLGLDYAYGFDRRDVLGRPNPGWQLHFKFGRVF
ncbi:outer membrane protein assembly factor BamA [Candidatus Palauibacter sp.]|uniref:outer membrane protein assembly factor BamA n=1 Tax=Candidatus Palauibacter sp. TaxID=3101350 RepID=UPI003B0173A5